MISFFKIKSFFLQKSLYKNIKNFKLSVDNVGWGRKKSGFKAIESAKKNHVPFLLLEDGFIRSIGLGVDGSKSFSLVEDNIGIYYDATSPSKLEIVLKENEFNDALLFQAQEAISLIKKYKISKYNNAPLELPVYLKTKTKKVLIIAQTKGDSSLQYGYAETFDHKEIVLKALENNPDADIYLKIHPDVLAGKKESNIDIEFAKKHCKIITENINPIILLEVFEKVYTQTSQMGFEALLLGKKVEVFGAPFYVGWHLENLTWHLDEKIKEEILQRRGKNLSLIEIFAGAYILYTTYYNPYKKRKSDIIDTINEIVIQRKNFL